MSGVMKTFHWGVWLLTGVILSCSSERPLIKMEGYRPPLDESVVSPRFALTNYRRFMVLPPTELPLSKFSGACNQNMSPMAGSAPPGIRDAKEPRAQMTALMERELLRQGLIPISADISGRAVDALIYQKNAQATERLSDVERALLLARRTGADALFQIVRWDWSEESVPRRFFILPSNSSSISAFHEVTSGEYANFHGIKYSFAAPDFHFVARVLTVDTGEVLAVFSYRVPANFALQNRYIASVQPQDRVFSAVENYSYQDKEWLPDAEALAEGLVAKAAVQRVILKK